MIKPGELHTRKQYLPGGRFEAVLSPQETIELVIEKHLNSISSSTEFRSIVIFPCWEKVTWFTYNSLIYKEMKKI